MRWLVVYLALIAFFVGYGAEVYWAAHHHDHPKPPTTICTVC